MTRRDIAIVLALFLFIGGLYLAQPVIGPLFCLAAVVLVAGEALISVVDERTVE